MYPLPVPPMPRGGEALGAWWDEAAARKAVAFFPRFLRHTEGEWAGKPFHLTEWQRDRIIRPLFGWKRADGTRLFRKLWLEVPRKNGKTELLAGVALLAFLGDGERGGQGYSMAVDKDQAKIVFDKIGTMVGFSPLLQKKLTVFKTSVYCAELLAGFKPLSKGAGGKHGKSATVIVGDEVHEWTDGGELWDVIHKSTAARRQPLELQATTAGVVGEGYAAEMHDIALMVQSGEAEDPEWLVVIYAAEDDDDWQSEATWRKANPNYGISVKPDFMRAEARGAAQSARKENDFKRFHLNIWTEQVTRWLRMDMWAKCTREPKNPVLWKQLFEMCRGRRCYGGLDLAITDDITSLAWVFPPDEQWPMWVHLWRFWRPRDTIAEEPPARQKRYKIFEDAGALTVSPGPVTDYDLVRKQVNEDANSYDVLGLGIDKFNASQLAKNLKDDDGLPVVWFRQGTLSMNAPCRELERSVLQADMEHGNHPVAKWMAKNAATESDSVGNIKLVKGRAADKIDGMVSSAMGIGLHLTADPDASAALEAYLKNPVMVI